MSTQIAIMVVAQNIPENILSRYRECIRLSKPKYSYEIFFLRSKAPMKNFNKSKLLNKGIRSLVPQKYELIIQTDIDLVVPPGIVDASYELSREEKVCFYNHHRRVDAELLPKLPEEYDKMDWSQLMTLKTENANGCWNAMKPQDWWSTGGFNEYMIEWGKEDDEWRSRAGRVGKIRFLNYNHFCLLHINHPARTRDMRKYNRTMANRAEREGKLNWLI